jgi:predicted dithiol-disulfide oxidoreductase (DUF899 family)
MGWDMPWYTITDSFNVDFSVGPVTRRYPQTPPYQWWNWHDQYSAHRRWGETVDSARSGKA